MLEPPYKAYPRSPLPSWLDAAPLVQSKMSNKTVDRATIYEAIRKSRSKIKISGLLAKIHTDMWLT